MGSNVYGIDWLGKLDRASAPAAVSTLQDEMNAVEAVAAAAEVAAEALEGGSHTVTAGEETAGEATHDTGRAAGALIACSVWRANVNVTGDAVVTIAAGVLSVADGSTYSVTENDVIRYIVL